LQQKLRYHSGDADFSLFSYTATLAVVNKQRQGFGQYPLGDL
jgi:hypothetical protein